MPKQTMKPKEAVQAVGYGYSEILTELLTSLNRPITNSDEFRNYYKQMLSNDETIGTGIEYLTGRIVSRIGAYSHEDEKIKELVDASIENIRGTLTEVRRSILRDSFAYGFGVGEFTIESVKNQWLLSSVQILDPSSVQFKMEQFDDSSYGIGAVIQKSGMTEVEIPAGKCIIKTYGSSSTPYGKSLLRRCYRWWSLKNALPKLWAVCLERFGMPILHGKASSNSTRKELNEALSNLNSRSYITTDDKSEIQAISTPSGAISSNYHQAEELCDKMMYRAMFLPSLLGSGENGGSYSLGQVHFELFNATAAALAEDYIDAELEQLWRPLIEWNFGEQENYGNFVINDTTPISEKVSLSSMFMNLAQVGMLDIESDRNLVREMLGLPELDEGAITPRWELEQATPQRDET
ncbi:MAG: DUF935 family protein [Synergistaceae bacterium]|nr:DUF935 family protein [Synergistaceae bacterium]